MKKIACLFILIAFGLLHVSAENLPKKAADNPLDFAFYLVAQDDGEKADALASAFFDVGRFDDAARSIALLDNEFTQINWLAIQANALAERKNLAKAEEYVNRALEIIKAEDVSVDTGAAISLAQLLIGFNRDADAVRLIENVEREETLRIVIAREFLKTGKTAEALKLLPPLSQIKDDDDKAEVIELSARLKQTEKAEKMLAEFEPTAFVNTPIYHNRRFILFPLINANLALGKTERAVALWEQNGEMDDGYGWTKFIEALIDFEQREKASVYLTKIAADAAIRKSDGEDIVRIYLKIGDVETAINYAKTMADDFDSHEQQNGLMLVADYLIGNGKTAVAAEILDFALRRAAPIEFRHADLQSNSSGTRKRNYLYNIYTRFMKIGQFPKALAAIDAIGSEHWIAQEFVMESLFDFIKTRAKNQPRRETDLLLVRMQKSLTERDDDYHQAKAKLFSAEIYALLGDKTKATELLGKVIAEGRESCCYEFGFLLDAGKVFDKYKLKADADFKKVLRDFRANPE